MYIYPLFLTPAANRQACYDGMHEELANFDFSCQDCVTSINVRVLNFIATAQSWFDGLTEIEQTQIVRLFSCDYREFDGQKLVLSQDSGLPYFGVVTCHFCACDHLLYVSHCEKQAARYIARFQGGAKIAF